MSYAGNKSMCIGMISELCQVNQSITLSYQTAMWQFTGCIMWILYHLS